MEKAYIVSARTLIERLIPWVIALTYPHALTIVFALRGMTGFSIDNMAQDRLYAKRHALHAHTCIYMHTDRAIFA